MSADDIIEWSKTRKLEWSDFCAEPHPAAYQDAVSKIKYHFTWTVTSEKFGSELFFLIENIKLVTVFQKNLSWVKEQLASDSLLVHQQGVFDLAEEIKPKISSELEKHFTNKKFPVRGSNETERMQYAKEDSGNMISSVLEKLFDKYYIASLDKYESDTEFGENKTKQTEYNARFSKLR